MNWYGASCATPTTATSKVVRSLPTRGAVSSLRAVGFGRLPESSAYKPPSYHFVPISEVKWYEGTLSDPLRLLAIADFTLALSIERAG